jgi:hypothetical protein
MIDHRFKWLVRVRAFAGIWSLQLCDDKKNIFSDADHLPMHNFALFMTVSTTCGETRIFFIEVGTYLENMA